MSLQSLHHVDCYHNYFIVPFKTFGPCLAMIVLFSHRLIVAQNLIPNADFEEFEECPTNLGQINKATHWKNMVHDADYYNCGLQTDPYVSDSKPYSGEGFVGFAGSNGEYGSMYAEAIGTALLESMIPGTTYLLTFVAKSPLVGTYSGNCSGLAVVGFKDNAPTGNFNIHVSELDGSQYLGNSPPIQDSIWQVFSLELVPFDTINYLSFSVEYDTSCTIQCIFLDSVSLLVNTSTYIVENQRSIPHIFPNPSPGAFTILSAERIEILEVYSMDGRMVETRSDDGHSYHICIENRGVYIIRITSQKSTISRLVSVIN